MSLKDKKFPKFEVPASYEGYAEGGYLADAAPVPAPAPRPSDAPAQRTFEEQVSAVVTCVGAQNALREVLYKTLAHCEEPRDFAEAEAFVAAQDEFVHSHIIQTPFTLIQMLLRAGGLAQTALDAQGAAIPDERLAALPEDEADDLVATYRLATTPAGAETVRLLAPERRIEAQLGARPHRRATYYAVLAFCQEPRTFPQIEEFFKATPDLVQDTVASHHKLSPDFYIDKLDKAGALVWRGAWVATDAGKRMLAAHKHAAGMPS